MLVPKWYLSDTLLVHKCSQIHPVPTWLPFWRVPLVCGKPAQVIVNKRRQLQFDIFFFLTYVVPYHTYMPQTTLKRYSELRKTIPMPHFYAFYILSLACLSNGLLILCSTLSHIVPSWLLPREFVCWEKKKSPGYWWLSISCRADASKCLPYITAGSWGLDWNTGIALSLKFLMIFGPSRLVVSWKLLLSLNIKSREKAVLTIRFVRSEIVSHRCWLCIWAYDAQIYEVEHASSNLELQGLNGFDLVMMWTCPAV